MRFSRLVTSLAVAATLVLGACGDGEDRPGQVTTESEGGTGTGTGSASGTHSGSASGTGTGSGGGHDHGEQKAAFAEGQEDTRVEVTMRDYAFSMPTTIKGPKVLFVVTNEGASEHEFLVVDEGGKEVGGLEPFGKGVTKTLALELQPGAYRAQCLVKEGQRTHAELGMETPFTVE